MSTPMTVMPPSRWLLLLEASAPLEYAASLAAAPWLLNAPRGDGHPVIVYPGFLASDTSTRPLRRLLLALGHDAHGWEQGRNLGARPANFEQALAQLHALHAESARRVSLVGWSLGGLYARELAKRAPDAVRSVVTLGSPFTGPRDANRAARTYRRLQRGQPATAISHADLHEPPPCPTTSIFSRSDGIVAWPCSVQAAGPQAESIEVRASHLGLGVNPFALHALADRLAQPEGAWQPFDRRGARRLFYPDPYRTPKES
ncbi:MAG: alpha/beta hydrolase [Rubrivivax sp.]